MKKMKTKNFSIAKTLVLVLIGALALSCEDEGIMESERPTISHELALNNVNVIPQRPCTSSDPAVAAIHIDYSTFPIHVLLPGSPSPHFNFTIDFTNLGAVPWNTDGASFQCYRSKDALLDYLDLPAGGSDLSTIGVPPTLQFMQLHTCHWTNTIFTSDFLEYPYLIVKINLNRVLDCNENNNYLVEHINFPVILDEKI
jgi:hypothetical protein